MKTCSSVPRFTSILAQECEVECNKGSSVPRFTSSLAFSSFLFSVYAIAGPALERGMLELNHVALLTEDSMECATSFLLHVLQSCAPVALLRTSVVDLCRSILDTNRAGERTETTEERPLSPAFIFAQFHASRAIMPIDLSLWLLLCSKLSPHPT